MGPPRRTRLPASSATATSGDAAQILGQAYVSAYNLILRNKDAVEKIADTLVQRREVFGDDLLRILDGVGLKKPELDLDKEETWPRM